MFNGRPLASVLRALGLIALVGVTILGATALAQQVQSPSLRTARDILVLRAGESKQGKLQACSVQSCTVDGIATPRDNILVIGLHVTGFDMPRIRDMNRNEVHFIDETVRDEKLVSLDATNVVTENGVYSRARVAWIYLAAEDQRVQEPAPAGGRFTPPSRPNSSASAPDTPSAQSGPPSSGPDAPPPARRADGGKLPGQIFIWAPNAMQCANCISTLHVIDIDVKDEQVFVVSGRTIESSSQSLRGYWLSFYPPQPFFPATTRSALASAHEVKPGIRVTENWYFDGGPDGYKGHGERAGKGDAGLSVVSTNWQLQAKEFIDSEIPGWRRYLPLRDRSAFDVEAKLDVFWRDWVWRYRRVAPDGYTDDEFGNTRYAAQLPRSASDAQPKPESDIPYGVAWADDQFLRLIERLFDAMVRDIGGQAPTASGGGSSIGNPYSGSVQSTVPLSPMRWFRADGRIGNKPLSDDIDIRQDMENGRLPYVISATLPDGAVDMEKPPEWTPLNPKPPPPAPPAGSGFMRP